MTEVNFSSTFRIPVTQPGVNKAKKVKLKGLVDSYGGLVGTGNTGYARVSIPNEKDESFLRKLKSVGYKVFQVFEGENISRKSLDDYIKRCLNARDYKQVGKQKAKVSNVKSKLNYMDYTTDNKFEQPIQDIKQEKAVITPKKIVEETKFFNREAADTEHQNRIRNSESYKDIVARYGEEAAEAIFFYSRKKI